MEIRANKEDGNEIEVNNHELSDMLDKEESEQSGNSEVLFSFEKKQSFWKKARKRIDQYFYDIEIIFKTDMTMKLDRKRRNEYIFRSFFTFFFCFIFSYIVFTAYFIVTSKINQHHHELDQRIKANGTEIVFEEVNKHSQLPRPEGRGL